MGESFRKWGSSCTALAMVLCATGAGGFAKMRSGGKSANPRIGVFVYNYARVSPEVLGDAEKTAAWIFRDIGIEIEWFDGPVPGLDRQRSPTCQRRIRPTDCFIHILPQHMIERACVPGVSDRVVGFALPWTRSMKSFGVAYVFYNRLENLALNNDIPVRRVLAYVTSHELGHLILGWESHASLGIMSALWNGEHLRRAGVGALYFTPEQGRLMRSRVLKRASQAEIGVSASGNRRVPSGDQAEPWESASGSAPMREIPPRPWRKRSHLYRKMKSLGIAVGR